MRLHESMAVHQGEPENVFYLDSEIKRFEYTFEVSRKLLRRFLIDCDPEVARIPVNDLHRFVELGVQQALLKSDWAVWRGLRDARNITAHDYGEEKAREVARSAPPMLEEATFLLEALNARIPQEASDAQS